MCMRSVVCGSLVALLLALGGGCGKSTPGEGAGGRQPFATNQLPRPNNREQALNPQPAAEVVARVHWIGMKRLATEANAASFMRVWSLPETAKLEAQTLDKLAFALVTSNRSSVISNQSAVAGSQSQLIGYQSPITNYQSLVTSHPIAALLRPLLDDLVTEESCLEVRQATNGPGTLALALRLDAQRAALWQTNLATAIDSTIGTHPTPTTNGWQVLVQSPKSKVQSPESVVSNQWSIALTRSGEWTLLALAPASICSPSNLLYQVSTNLLSTTSSSLSNALRLDPTTRRLRSVPGSPTTNFWLEANGDLGRVASALSFGSDLPEDLPTLSLEVTGNGKDVLTSGRLNFPKPLRLEMEPWNIPTNLVHDPLDSFTAIRGIQPWLASLKAWNDLQVGAPPKQLFFWAQPATLPFMTYCAAPLPDASNRVYGVTERLLQECNSWITNNTVGRLERSTNDTSFGWLGVPFMIPFLRSAADGGSGFAFGGLFAYPFTNQPPPGLLFQQVTARTNLVYYDWELTAPRVNDWIHIGQLLRLLFGKASLPPDSASMAWLNAAKTNLTNSVTGVGATGPAQLTFARVSTIGLTALEMHLLADWLESPQFPRGLNTFVGPQRPFPRPGTAQPIPRNLPKPASAPPTNR